MISWGMALEQDIHKFHDYNISAVLFGIICLLLNSSG
jgi:hypothetical protein